MAINGRYYLIILILLFCVSKNIAQPILAAHGSRASRQKVDLDANKYATAAGVTTDTAKLFADFRFAKNLKGHADYAYATTDQWAQFYLIYPYQGTTLNSFSYNLIDTTLYKSSFIGRPDVKDTGVIFNGVTQYQNSNFNETIITTNNFSAGISIRNNLSATTAAAFGSGGTSATILRPMNGVTTTGVSGMSGGISNITNSTFRGLFEMFRKDNSTIGLTMNGGSELTVASVFNSKKSTSWFIGAQNNGSGAPSAFPALSSDFFFVRNYFSSTDRTNFMNAYNSYKSRINR